MFRPFVWLLLFSSAIASCKKTDVPTYPGGATPFFETISATSVGKAGAAEITAYDPLTKKLFVVSNTGTSQIDILDVSNPAAPVRLGAIAIDAYGGGVNSVAVSNGHLAAAIEGSEKTNAGKAVIFKTTDYSVVAQVAVGALPDMITYSPNGAFIVTANEGEPNSAYTIDPVGSVSVIAVKNNYAVTTINFESVAAQQAALQAKGLRVFGPNARFAQDMEPEYVTISADSKTVWVTLQENNAIAKIDIPTRRVEAVFPLGFKQYNSNATAIDASDKDGAIAPKARNVRGMYQPDAIAVFEKGGLPFLFTANEGDAREYDGFVEGERVKNLLLDAAAFPNAMMLQQDDQLGRLNITKTLGDADGDGDFNTLYSFGARSFSVWQGTTGQLLWDSKNELEQQCITAGVYDDARSDDKGVEPEGLAVGTIGGRTYAFVGMERADAVAVYNVTDPFQPRFVQLLATGDAPEGITFIPAAQSPSGKNLLVVSSENDGLVKIFSTQ